MSVRVQENQAAKDMEEGIAEAEGLNMQGQQTVAAGTSATNAAQSVAGNRVLGENLGTLLKKQIER